jgi:hypothetical protein
MRILAIGLAMVLAAALVSQGPQSAEAAEKGESRKKGAADKYQTFRSDGTVPSAGLYGASDLAERSYQKDGGKKGLRSRGKSHPLKNKYIEYRKMYDP